MAKRRYDWTRYWYPKDNQLNFGKDGLLQRMDSPFYSLLYGLPDPQQFVEINSLFDVPCLVLLGEPGMGKSHALKEDSRQFLNTNIDLGSFHNMADFETSSELDEEIFQNDGFSAWRQTDAIYHLFLDSLDEARIHIRTITKKLIKNFQNDSDNLKRLRIRITCRTADWPLGFEEALRELWGKENVAVYILAPLQQQDVIQAAQQNELIDDVDNFWREVVEKEAVSFAARPITLDFLLDEYAISGRLPRTREELYERGCRKLCAELNESHAERDKLESEHRFIVATRIAAATMFTGYLSIRLKELVENRSNSLTIEDCAGGKETLEGLEFYVHDSYVRETLDTSLFHGGEVREWAHQTYAEFLAAWYVSRVLSIPQIKSLIFHPDGKLIPQLHETAAWIATFETEIFDLILKSDPEVLLRSDVTTGDDQSREKLVRALLCRKANNLNKNFYWKQLSSLKCNNLLKILQDVVQDETKEPQVRELGIDIAIACEVSELQDLMAEIALDSQQPILLRTTSAQGVNKLGGERAKQKLKRLAMLTLENRRLGTLKWHGIQATWPEYLTAKELFATLVAPTGDDNLMDSYVLKDWSNIVLSDLRIDDLPIALNWVQYQAPFQELPTSFIDLLNHILLRAWDHIELPEIAIAFCQATIALWQRYDNVIIRHRHRQNPTNNPNLLTADVVMENRDKRYLFVKALIPIASGCEQITNRLFNDIPLLSFDDAPWLIDYFDNSQSSQEKAFVITLIHHTVRLNEPDQFQFIYNAGQEHPDIWQALNYKLFIELNSEEAERTRRIYFDRLERDRQNEEYRQQQERSPIYPSPKERALAYLERFERGERDTWWRMSRWLEVLPDGMGTNKYKFEYDARSLPVWNELSNLQQSRIVDSAINFLQRYNPDTRACNDSWHEKRKSTYFPIVAGCRALFLLVEYERIDMLAEFELKKWAPALTYYIYRSLRYLNEDHKRKQKEILLQCIRAVASEEVEETLVWIAQHEDQQEHFLLPSRIEGLWNISLANKFLKLIKKERFEVANEAQILRSICNYDFNLSESLLRQWLTIHLSNEERAKQRAILAGQLFLEFAEDADWNSLWPKIQSDVNFGKKVIEGVIFSDYHMRDISGGLVARKLDEIALADLYVWLFRQYAPENDPKREGGFSKVTHEHKISDFRDSLPRRLAERGTKKSVEELERIQKELGVDLSYYLVQAHAGYLQNTWQPLKPNEFRELLQNKRTRWVQSGSQLLDMIVELLSRLNLDLQGELPSAVDLWNENKRTVKVNGKQKRETFYTPKDENRLSDYVARYLKENLAEDGILISRENQVRRGSFTDIFIESRSVSPSGEFGQPITVVVEVKGCWNKELKTGMENQLKNRYLIENNYSHGIYLIGQFLCDAWDASDYKRGASPNNNDIELLKFYKNQADGLSDSEHVVRAFLLDAKL